jgi:hypothetical protein
MAGIVAILTAKRTIEYLSPIERALGCQETVCSSDVPMAQILTLF